MFIFFSGGSNRQNPILTSLLSLILGIFLIRFPGMSGKLFCFALAASALIYAAIRLLRYARDKKQGYVSQGDQFLGVFLLIVGLFILFFPRFILSFLPLTLGILLFLAGFSKIPFVMDAFQMRSPARIPFLLSTLAPLILGGIMLMNPFGVTRLVIRFFGVSLIINAILELTADFFNRKNHF